MENKVYILLMLFFCCINTYSQTADDFIVKGNEKFEKKDYEGAVLDYTKSIELNDKDANAYYKRGLSKLFLKEKNSGCSNLNKAMELGSKEAVEIIKKYCN